MDNITRLIEALREVQSDFTALGQDRAFQGIVLTFANTCKPRAGEFHELLPKAAVDRKIKNPVSIKALGGSEVRGGQTTSCPTCGKHNSVPPQQNNYVSGNVLRLTRKVEETPLPMSLQEAKEAVEDFIGKVGQGMGLTMEEAGQSLIDPTQIVGTFNADEITDGLTNLADAAQVLSVTSEGTGISPVHFDNPENILTGEPVIESNEWVAVLQEVNDVKQAKELYKAITGKGYPPRWPQELDQIAKAIWQARQKIEI
jgi:hypothetical protein